MFKKATKQQAKLRAAVFGPSGAGKTMSALRIATGLGGRIAVLDTERGSASKYADRFEFDVAEPATHDIGAYCAVIQEAGRAGYGVLVIDSLSHAWQQLLEEIDRLAKTKFRGNTWSAWSEGTPKQRELIDAILHFPGHVIATMRSKTAWETGDAGNGKSKPVRVGLAPEQGKGIEYEFDLLLEISVDHVGSVIKDRTGRYQDKLIDRPGEEFGQELAAWLADGAAPVAVPSPASRRDVEEASGSTAAIAAPAAVGPWREERTPKGVRWGDMPMLALADMARFIGDTPEMSPKRKLQRYRIVNEALPELIASCGSLPDLSRLMEFFDSENDGEPSNPDERRLWSAALDRHGEVRQNIDATATV